MRRVRDEVPLRVEGRLQPPEEVVQGRGELAQLVVPAGQAEAPVEVLTGATPDRLLAIGRING
jgi:hypothetical protein